MMMPYKIAIVSHRRPHILASQTYKMLKESTVNLEDVTLFLSDERDAAEYAIIPLAQHVTKAANLRDKFNYVHFHYPAGTRVLVLEDDVALIDKSGAAVTDIGAMAELGFTSVGEHGLWGIAPHANTFYFSGKVTHTLKLVVAHCFGFIATQEPALAITQPTKTDYERTLLYFQRYGAVTRLDMYGVKTKSYTQAGGMQSDHTRAERHELEQAACDYLVKQYNGLVSHNTSKKSLHAELRLARVG